MVLRIIIALILMIGSSITATATLTFVALNKKIQQDVLAATVLLVSVFLTLLAGLIPILQILVPSLRF